MAGLSNVNKLPVDHATPEFAAWSAGLRRLERLQPRSSAFLQNRAGALTEEAKDTKRKTAETGSTRRATRTRNS